MSFAERRLIAPLQLSTGTIDRVTQAQAEVTVELASVRATAEGRGSIYLSDLWAWPDARWSHDERDRVLRGLCESIVKELPALFGDEWLHPLEMGLRLHHWVTHEFTIPSDPPALARSMCASPFDAAIHDAVGIGLGISSFGFYNVAERVPSADRFFPSTGAIQAISAMLQPPRRALPAWWIVGKDGNLATELAEPVRRRGIYCFKLKITGRDNRADAERTCELFHAAQRLGVNRPRITVDSNEANPDAQSVLEYLGMLEALDPAAYSALEYLEQPTSRDIGKHAFDWTPVTARKPVMLDEGLADLPALEEARRQGWSGVALKTCKGHSMLMAAAAWAHRNGMPISLQDLTNPGISLIHAALVGAHLPTINGAELNSPQFTPEANREYVHRLPDLFEPRNGEHAIPTPAPIGLGSLV